MSNTSKIYFISAGTGVKDLDKKTDKNDLSYNGFKELINLKENKYFKDNILNNINSEFLVSANICCIESALILFSSDTLKKNVSILPYLDKDRKKKVDYIKFFRGNIDAIGRNFHYLQKLSFSKNQRFVSIIKEFPKLNYNLTNLNKNEKYYKFDLQKFVKYLENMIVKNPGKNMVVLCESDLIRYILTKMPGCTEYFNIKKENIENSSIIEIDIILKSATSNIKYDFCSKVYPTSENYKPLKYDSEKKYKYSYDLGGKDFPIFDKSRGIPLNLVKKINKPVNNSNNIITILNKTNTTISSNKNNIKSILGKLQTTPIS
jgi:hypothetical protein